jgi:hypothetical protein
VHTGHVWRNTTCLEYIRLECIYNTMYACTYMSWRSCCSSHVYPLELSLLSLHTASCATLDPTLCTSRQQILGKASLSCSLALGIPRSTSSVRHRPGVPAADAFTQCAARLVHEDHTALLEQRCHTDCLQAAARARHPSRQGRLDTECHIPVLLR